MATVGRGKKGKYMPPHWKQNHVYINGIRLHYFRTGNEEKRPLVLVHGFSDNGLCWTPTARDLESEYDVIMPDMRAHGLSARVQPGEKVDMAADLSGLILSLRLKCPVIVGHSMGAMVAYQTGLRFPGLVRALFLEDPPWWLSRSVQASSVDPAMENPIAKWAKTLPRLTMGELLAQYHKDHPNWSEELVRLMCESKKQLDPAIVDTMVERMNSQESDWTITIQKITQPMLILTGNPELGGIVTPEVVAKVREANPRVIIENIPDVGHLIHFDTYNAFMQILGAFLKQVS
jgi:N-formylmaleamate deformylase